MIATKKKFKKEGNNFIVRKLSNRLNGSDLIQFQDDITLQPGETMTMAARADTTVLDYCSIVLTTREDQ